MNFGTDSLKDLPKLAALGAERLNFYCQEWLATSIAKEFAVTAIHVDDDLRFHPTVTLNHAFHDREDVIMPIDEVLRYIVDRHFDDEQIRSSLHERISENRRRSGPAGRIYRADLGEKFTFYLTCKSPECRSVLRTPLNGYLGVQYTCEPTEPHAPSMAARIRTMAATCTLWQRFPSDRFLHWADYLLGSLCQGGDVIATDGLIPRLRHLLIR